MLEKIIIIILIVQGVMSLLSVAMLLYDYKISQKDYGSGIIFVSLFILETFLPVTGACMSGILCVNCFYNIINTKHPIFVQKCANQPSKEEIEELNKNIRIIPVCKYQTNAEYIRSLSDEELADMLHNNGYFVEDGEPKLEMWLKEKQIIIDDSFGCILDWLQSEVDDSKSK